MKKIIYTLLFSCTTLTAVFAGNPDRQGEAGAYELLLNPWARSAGLKNLVTGNVSGVEALQINPAGIGRMSNKMQIMLGHTRYLVGSDISFNAIGYAQKIGTGGAFGVSVMQVDFGDISRTTTGQPDRTDLKFQPLFVNIAVSYAQTFSERISVALAAKFITEQIDNAGANGVAFDAGVQYHTSSSGDSINNIHFGISLRNVGTKMTFKGDGLTYSAPEPNGNYDLTLNRPSRGLDMPSQLNIGAAYDFLMAQRQRFTVVANFTANSYTRDQMGVGLEYSLRDMFMVRVGYSYEKGQFDSSVRTNTETGLAAGVSLQMPISKKSKSKVGLDYSYRTTNPFGGTHNIGFRMDL